MGFDQRDESVFHGRVRRFGAAEAGLHLRLPYPTALMQGQCQFLPLIYLNTPKSPQSTSPIMRMSQYRLYSPSSHDKIQ